MYASVLSGGLVGVAYQAQGLTREQVTGATPVTGP
jgi:hypothetical protein